LRLKEFDLTWVEEPVGAEDLHGHRVVREAVRPVPIQTGENWWFPPIGGVTGWIFAAGQICMPVTLAKITIPGETPS
jgi:mandelate racemase